MSPEDGPFTAPPAPVVWASHLSAARAVAELARELGGTPLLGVKGLVTARTLYADVSERPIADADLRVRPEDLARVRAAASTAGLVEVHAFPSYGSVLFRGRGVDVDVETTIGAPFMTGLAVADLLSASIDGAPLGLACRVPCDVDHALVLAVNLFKDKLCLGAPWSVDDALRLGSSGRVEPGSLAARAARFGMSALVEVVGHFLAGHGSAFWAAVATDAGHRHGRAAYVAACKALFAWAPEGLLARLVARCSADAPGLRLRALRAGAAFAGELRSRRRIRPRA